MEDRIKEQIKDIPQSPGVYIFKNAEGIVIYVGKAIKLRDRLKHYGQSSNSSDPKLRVLVSNIYELEIIRTNNELEALILESNLVKKYKPRYNIQLKDDKAYPYIKIDLKKEWPMLEIVRRFTNDGAVYFGPYVSARGLRSLISVINKVFPLRKCSDSILRSAKRPCLNYQIHTCMAPCQGYIEKKDYKGLVEGALNVLKGKIFSVIEDLEKEMLLASDNLDFEEAARIRERIKVLDVLYSRQSVVISGDTRNIDVITFKKTENIHVFNMLLIRNGLLLGQTNVVVDGNGTDEEAMNRFIVEHYSKNILPDLISLPFEIKDTAVIGLIKTLSADKKIQLSSRSSSEIKRVRKIGEGNLDEYIRMMNTKRSRWANSSSELCKLLGVPESSISTIECYDMSNTSGQFAVGAKVFFLDGVPAKDSYRKYKIKGDYRGDDLKTMQEVFLRRIEKIEEEPLPDLIILDGGKTQLNAVAGILRALSLKSYRLISIAKDRSTSKGLSIDKLYYLDGEEMSTLEPSKALLNFIKMIRDEAHRFVINYHRQLRQKGFKN